MIRDRLALAITALTVGGLTTLAAIANLEDVPRSVDIIALWLAGALQLGLVLTWVLIPRLPRWIVAGWGLILIADRSWRRDHRARSGGREQLLVGARRARDRRHRDHRGVRRAQLDGQLNGGLVGPTALQTARTPVFGYAPPTEEDRP